MNKMPLSGTTISFKVGSMQGLEMMTLIVQSTIGTLDSVVPVITIVNVSGRVRLLKAERSLNVLFIANYPVLALNAEQRSIGVPVGEE